MWRYHHFHQFWYLDGNVYFFVVRIALLIKENQQIEKGETGRLVVSINMFKQKVVYHNSVRKQLPM